MNSRIHVVGIGSRSHNDCFVQSLANLLGCSYGTAEHQARIYGYIPNTGMAIRGLMPAFDKLAPCYTLSAYGYMGLLARYFRKQNSCQRHDSAMSLKTWLARNQTGTFAVLQKDHIFIVVNGVVYDNNAPKWSKMVNATFEFTDAPL
ncbi:MAG: hypothetical protein KGI54_17830 [Pseudomonadota bacterium]|nr:hypothetical protein [Pseudomonadota bacterium]